MMFPNHEGRFSSYAPPPNTHILWQSHHIPSKCIGKGFVCRPADTCTAAVSAWPTHPAEETGNLLDLHQLDNCKPKILRCHNPEFPKEAYDQVVL